MSKNEVEIITGDDFRKSQLLQLDMLVELDRVCRANNIKYSIACGTLLGAIRHKGYIPWDDDTDVSFLREEYEKFKAVANQLNPDICFFQDHSTDPEYRWGYGKLRRTGTTYIRVGQEHLKAKTGLYIDLFPTDDVPRSVIGQMLQDFYCFILRKIAYSEVGKVSEINPFKRFVYSILNHISIETVFKKLDKMAKKSKTSSPNRVRLLSFTATGKLFLKQPLKIRYSLEKSWFTDLAEYEFEGYHFFGPKDYDAYLKYSYGDYMTPPPPEKRIARAPCCKYDFNDVEPIYSKKGTSNIDTESKN